MLGNGFLAPCSVPAGCNSFEQVFVLYVAQFSFLYDVSTML
jgi:hypothetical protein